MITDLDEPLFVEIAIGGEVRTFVVERTRDGATHPCTVDDVASLLNMVDPSDIDGLQLVIFRQPTRKQVVLSPVWGRLRYFTQLGRHRGAALILDAGPTEGVTVRFRRSMGIDDEAELERFRRDGQRVVEDRRSISVLLDTTAQREVQLYRTVLHEVGHHVDYLEKVQRPSDDGDDDWDALWSRYWQRPAREREVFAHAYADRMASDLRTAGQIPFDRIDDPERIRGLGLRQEDFEVRPGSADDR